MPAKLYPAEARIALDRTLARLGESERRRPEIEAAARERAKAEFAALDPELFAQLAKVAGGEYATESEVETWLREQVVPAAMELEADPSQALTPAQVRAHLAQRRQTRARAGKA